MKALRIVAVLVIAAGACLTGRALYLHAKAELADVLVRRAWEQTLLSGKPQPPWPWADTHPVARLEIPRIGYDEIVLEGAAPRTLAFGPARLLSSARPGEPGNMVLAGHRTSWFLPLESVRVGDQVVIEWRGGKRRYAVSEIHVVDPADTAWLEPTAHDALTLVTCYPFGRRPTSPQRYVVRADPVDLTPQAEASSRCTVAPAGQCGREH